MERLSIPVSILLLLISPLMANDSSQSYGPPSSSSSFASFNRNQESGGYQGFRSSLSSSSSSGNFAGGARGNDPGNLGASIQGPKVFRHISLFVAPQDPSDQPGLRTIRTQQGAPDKHVNIIFIRAPSRSSSQQTEVQLPAQPEQKTLVYVLVKKPEEGVNNIKIRGPSPTKPPAPEVYFIKYKDGNAAKGGYSGQGGGNRGSESSFEVSGGPSPVVRSSGRPSTKYGVPQ